MVYIPPSQGRSDLARQHEADVREVWSDARPTRTDAKPRPVVRVVLWIIGVLALAIAVVIAVMQLTS